MDLQVGNMNWKPNSPCPQLFQFIRVTRERSSNPGPFIQNLAISARILIPYLCPFIMPAQVTGLPESDRTSKGNPNSSLVLFYKMFTGQKCHCLNKYDCKSTHCWTVKPKGMVSLTLIGLLFDNSIDKT